MKIKSLIAGIIMLVAGGIVGMVVVWGGLAMWQCHAPYDAHKWSAILQTILGSTAYDKDKSQPFDINYYAIHTLENGRQIREKINPLEFSTRFQKSAATDFYAMRDGVVTECGKNSILVKHSSISEVFCSNLHLNMPCQVGMKIEGGQLLGTNISAKAPREDQ